MTKYEDLLYKALQDEGFTVTRQKEFSYEDDQGNQNSIEVDLSIDEYNLAIEVDGRHHNQDDQRERDAWRDRTIQKNGYKVVHFQNSEVMADIEGLIDEVYDLISSTTDKSKDQIETAIQNKSSNKGQDHTASIDIEIEDIDEIEDISDDFDGDSETSQNSILQKTVGIVFLLGIVFLFLQFFGVFTTCSAVCEDYCVEKGDRANKSFRFWSSWETQDRENESFTFWSGGGCAEDTCNCQCHVEKPYDGPGSDLGTVTKIVPMENPKSYSNLSWAMCGTLSLDEIGQT